MHYCPRTSRYYAAGHYGITEFATFTADHNGVAMRGEDYSTADDTDDCSEMRLSRMVAATYDVADIISTAEDLLRRTVINWVVHPYIISPLTQSIIIIAITAVATSGIVESHD